MQSPLLDFSTPRIDRTEETKQAWHERDADTRHSSLWMVPCVLLLLPCTVLPGEKELD